MLNLLLFIMVDGGKNEKYVKFHFCCVMETNIQAIVESSGENDACIIYAPLLIVKTPIVPALNYIQLSLMDFQPRFYPWIFHLPVAICLKFDYFSNIQEQLARELVFRIPSRKRVESFRREKIAEQTVGWVGFA